MKKLLRNFFLKERDASLDPPISADTARLYAAIHAKELDKQKEEAMWKWMQYSIEEGNTSALFYAHEWPTYGRELMESLGYIVVYEAGDFIKGSTVPYSITEVTW